MICRVSKEYPTYRVATKSGHIVKFTEACLGHVVKAGTTRPVGYYSNQWVKHTYTDVWRKLTGLEISELGGKIDFESCVRLK